MTIRILITVMLVAVMGMLAACNLLGAPRWAAPVEGSRIVVYRPGDLTGFAKRFMLTLNGRNQAVIGNGQYFVMDVAPGRHAVALEEAGALLSIQALPAQAHYLRIRMVKQPHGPGAGFEPAAPQAAHGELTELNEADAWQPPQEEKFHAPASTPTGPRS